MNIEEIEARKKAATPLTGEEYATWKSNIEAIAEAQQEGLWYKREGDSFALTQHGPSGDLTTTVGLQLRLFATIDHLLAQLRDREEELEAEEEWREAKHTCPVDYCCWGAALASHDRILHPKEGE